MNALFLAPLAAIIFLCARYGSASWTLASPFMVWAGEASYSIYLLHMLVFFNVLHGRSPIATSNDFASALVRLIAALIFTVVMARGFYLIIEVPAQRAIRNSFNRLAAQIIAKPGVEVT